MVKVNRKKEVGEKSNYQISVLVPPSTRQALKRIADQEDRSFGGVVRLALREWLEQRASAAR